jgi:pyruvate formate lyase activating enzyme
LWLPSRASKKIIEVLPFHKIGEYKWKELGFPYLLENTEPPTAEQIEAVKAIFRQHGLRVE